MSQIFTAQTYNFEDDCEQPFDFSKENTIASIRAMTHIEKRALTILKEYAEIGNMKTLLNFFESATLEDVDEDSINFQWEEYYQGCGSEYHSVSIPTRWLWTENWSEEAREQFKTKEQKAAEKAELEAQQRKVEEREKRRREYERLKKEFETE